MGVEITYRICTGHIKSKGNKCEGCKHDYDTNHHPNNLDCPDRELVEVIDGTCIEHLRRSEGLKTKKPICETCIPDFSNRFCEHYFSYPPIKLEDFKREFDRRKPEFKERRINTSYIEENMIRCINRININLLRLDTRTSVDYNKIFDVLYSEKKEESAVNNNSHRSKKNKDKKN